MLLTDWKAPSTSSTLKKTGEKARNMGKYDIDSRSSDEEHDNHKASDYTDPVHSYSDEDGSVDEPVVGDQTLAPIKNNTVLEILSGIVAAASVATSVGAMILSPVNVVYASGGLSW